MSSIVDEWVHLREAWNQISHENCVARIKTKHTYDGSDKWTPWMVFNGFKFVVSRSIPEGWAIEKPWQRMMGDCQPNHSSLNIQRQNKACAAVNDRAVDRE